MGSTHLLNGVCSSEALTLRMIQSLSIPIYLTLRLSYELRLGPWGGFDSGFDSPNLLLGLLVITLDQLLTLMCLTCQMQIYRRGTHDSCNK